MLSTAGLQTIPSSASYALEALITSKMPIKLDSQPSASPQTFVIAAIFSAPVAGLLIRY